MPQVSFSQTTTQILSTISERKPRKTKHMFWSLFIFRGHSTREPAHSRVTYFVLRTPKLGRCFGKNAGEWTGRVEISKEKIPGSKCSMYGDILTYSSPGFIGRTFKLCVLNKCDFNFCVRSSPLRDLREGVPLDQPKRAQNTHV